jgi:hypothetical protein
LPKCHKCKAATGIGKCKGFKVKELDKQQQSKIRGLLQLQCNLATLPRTLTRRIDPFSLFPCMLVHHHGFTPGWHDINGYLRAELESSP